MTAAAVKRIVCLANSRMGGDRCIAGREVLAEGRCGGWIRPVSDREQGEVSRHERQYQDGSEPRVRDVIDVPVLGAVPSTYQQENWLLDPEQWWEKVRRVSREELAQFMDREAPLWMDGHSTNAGENDHIPLYIAHSLDSSLRLIKIDSLELSVDRGIYGKRRLKGRFRHSGTDYKLNITDPKFKQKHRDPPIDSNRRLGEHYLTISLGKPYGDSSYKLIAAVIKP